MITTDYLSAQEAFKQNLIDPSNGICNPEPKARKVRRARTDTRPQVVKQYQLMLDYAKLIHPDWEDPYLSALALELVRLSK